MQRTTADMIFVNVQLAVSHSRASAKKIKSLCTSPVVFYANATATQPTDGEEQVTYVQLPASIQSMGKVLKNLFAISTSASKPEEAGWSVA